MSLRRVIKETRNPAKALEVRIEVENEEKYYVTIAGMTVYHHIPCRGGTCDATPEGSYLFTDSNIYTSTACDSKSKAYETFTQYKAAYID